MNYKDFAIGIIMLSIAIWAIRDIRRSKVSREGIPTTDLANSYGVIFFCGLGGIILIISAFN